MLFVIQEASTSSLYCGDDYYSIGYSTVCIWVSKEFHASWNWHTLVHLFGNILGISSIDSPPSALPWCSLVYSHQILPEKYSYFRRVGRESNHVVDCVICMAAVDTAERSSECMVSFWHHFFSCWLFAKIDGYKDGMPTCRRPLQPV